MTRIFDCFCFFMELDMLELRLRALAPHVHRFVLAESIWDFAGSPKPLHYRENRARFAEFAEKIVHVVVDSPPARPDARWAWQRHQRDQMLRGLSEAAPEDLVMISDLDEIPRPEVLRVAQARLARRSEALVLEMAHYVHRLNLVQPGRYIAGTRMTRRRHLRVPHKVRQIKRVYWKGMPGALDQIPARANTLVACGWPIPRVVMPDAGWHFCSMGDRPYLDAKFRAFQGDEQLGVVQEGAFAADPGAVTEGGADGLERVGLDTLPTVIAKEESRFRHMLLP